MFNSGKVHSEPKITKNDWSMITYDQSRHKTAQDMLYEAARAREEKAARKKWDKFVEQIGLERLSDEQIKVLINNLDDRKQWAALHYAVDVNNTHVFDQLTAGEKRFRSDINIHGGNGENVLHIAARSDKIWEKKRQQANEETSKALVTTTEHCIEIQPKFGLPPIVRQLFTLKAHVKDPDDEGRTPLHLAVQANRYNYAMKLIDEGADIMAITKFNASVLYFALLPSRINNEELRKMVNLILDRASKIDDLFSLVTLDNQTPLARAVCHPAVTKELIKTLLDKNHKINQKQLLVAFDMVARDQKYTGQLFDYLEPLIDQLKKLKQDDGYQSELCQLSHIICRHNNKPLLEWFYKYINKVHEQLPINRNDGYAGYTPLCTAVFYNSKECVQFLLDETELINHDQRLLAENNDHENILHICAKRKIKQDLFNIVWKNLSETYGFKSKLMAMTDVEGNVPLELAARFGNEYMCKNLMEHMTNKSTKDEARRLVGRAALEASQTGNLKIFQLIIGHDLDQQKENRASDKTETMLRIRDENGYTCLHLSAEQGHREIVDFLVNNTNIEIDPIGDRHLTPLHLACEKGCTQVVQILLQAGASTILRNARVYNCLEIAIINQHKEVIQELFKHSTWRDMMRNAQPIEDTEAFDTPMRKLIRYMPDIAVWLIDNKFTQVVGGPEQKVYKTTYDYEFYEDMNKVINWYIQDVDPKSILKPKTCASLWHTRVVEAIHTCWCCCHSNDIGCYGCSKTKKTHNEQWYTNDAYILVRNQPLFIVSQQWDSPELVLHFYHTHLRQTKLRSFGLLFFILSYFFYMAYLGLFTSAVLMGKHPKFFYDKAQVNMTLDLSTCENVATFLINNPTVTSEAFKTETYKRIKWTLYGILSIFIAKNLITISVLFPKVLRVGGSYIEISALILSYVYILDWFDWQTDVMFRCPVQYQLGAMDLLLSYINLLVYLRTSPIFDIGIYVVMLQVISVKFLRFLPILLTIICGFGFTYWMLLQYQTVYGTPIEALMRTGLMLFDLGYESRLYDEKDGGQGYYTLVYVIFMLTAIACSIFVINLLIGLAVGEIPTLLTQGTLWRIQMLYSLLSDYEILRIRLVLAFDCVSCNIFRYRQIPWFRPRPYSILQKDELVGPMGKIGTLWNYTEKHFFHEQTQDNIKPSNKSAEKNNSKS